MKYTCAFVNAEGARRTISASLSACEVESVESLRRAKGTVTAEHAAAAYALRAAYREVPRGFEHSGPPIAASSAAEDQTRRIRAGVA